MLRLRLCKGYISFNSCSLFNLANNDARGRKEGRRMEKGMLLLVFIYHSCSTTLFLSTFLILFLCLKHLGPTCVSLRVQHHSLGSLFRAFEKPITAGQYLFFRYLLPHFKVQQLDGSSSLNFYVPLTPGSLLCRPALDREVQRGSCLLQLLPQGYSMSFLFAFGLLFSHIFTKSLISFTLC